MEDDSESIQRVIAQAEPGIKGSKGRQKLSMNDRASGLECGRISAGSGQNVLCKHAGPGKPSVIAVAEDGTVYAAGVGVTALDPTDGSVLWVGGGGEVPQSAGLAVGPDGTLYQAPGNASVVYALDPDDGTILWDQAPRSFRNPE